MLFFNNWKTYYITHMNVTITLPIYNSMNLIVEFSYSNRNMVIYELLFLESRRRALEKFLQRVAEHLELGNSPHLEIFVSADDSKLNEAKSASEVSKPKLTSRASSWFQSSVNTFSLPNGKV